MQNEEFLIKNACYSPAKYYLCKQNNKRSLLGRKQRSQVVRSFLNRYQFSCISKVTSLFSIRYTLINILQCDSIQVTTPCNETLFYLIPNWKKIMIFFIGKDNVVHFEMVLFSQRESIETYTSFLLRTT